MLQELAREHKQRLYFSFRLSRQHYGPEGAARAAELEPPMRSPLLEQWAAALNDMSYPAQRWQAWSGQLERLLHSNKKVRKRGKTGSPSKRMSHWRPLLRGSVEQQIVNFLISLWCYMRHWRA